MSLSMMLRSKSNLKVNVVTRPKKKRCLKNLSLLRTILIYSQSKLSPVRVTNKGFGYRVSSWRRRGPLCTMLVQFVRLNRRVSGNKLLCTGYHFVHRKRTGKHTLLDHPSTHRMLKILFGLFFDLSSGVMTCAVVIVYCRRVFDESRWPSRNSGNRDRATSIWIR